MTVSLHVCFLWDAGARRQWLRASRIYSRLPCRSKTKINTRLREQRARRTVCKRDSTHGIVRGVLQVRLLYNTPRAPEAIPGGLGPARLARRRLTGIVAVVHCTCSGLACPEIGVYSTVQYVTLVLRLTCASSVILHFDRRDKLACDGLISRSMYRVGVAKNGLQSMLSMRDTILIAKH